MGSYFTVLNDGIDFANRNPVVEFSIPLPKIRSLQGMGKPKNIDMLENGIFLYFPLELLSGTKIVIGQVDKTSPLLYVDKSAPSITDAVAESCFALNLHANTVSQLFSPLKNNDVEKQVADWKESWAKAHAVFAVYYSGPQIPQAAAMPHEKPKEPSVDFLARADRDALHPRCFV
jgi:hypothetical protein